MAHIRPPKKSATPVTKTLKSPETLMQDAFKLHQENKPQDAVAVCKKILALTKIGPSAESACLLWIRLAPDDANGWSLLGYVLYQNAKIDNAEDALNIALRLDPQLAETHSHLAMVKKNQGFLYEALMSFNNALAIDPDNKRYRTNRINVLIDMGLWDEAKIDLDVQLPKYPNDVPLLALAGRYYRAADDQKTALPYLKKAHALEPDNIAVLMNLVGCLGRLQQDPEGLYKMWQKLTQDIKKSPSFDYYVTEYNKIVHFIALYEKQPIDKADLILQGRNLDEVIIAEEDIDVTLIDETRRLYHFKNHFTHSEEWTLYNDKQLFANMMVVGSKKHANFGDDGSVYLSEANFPQIQLKGPHILLGGAENYYHWWIDFLPRLGIMQDFPEFDDLPIIVIDALNAGQLAVLEKLGVNLDRLVKIPVGHTVKCDHLIVPHLLGRPMTKSGLPDWMKPMVNDWGVNWVRDQFKDWLVPAKDGPKRIFISRIGTKFRRCVNEEEVYAIAQRYGFVTLKNEGLSFAEQMAIYAGAEMVMGPHGAGFTNMLFAPESATAIEMFPKHRSPPFYDKLCGQLGQRYIKFDGPITRLLPKMSIDFGDFYIDPVDVERVLAAL